MFEKAINFLLENACVNIQYLIRRDYFKIPISEPLMQQMQAALLQQKMVQKCLAAQHGDGWLGHELHGGDGMDNLFSVLLRLGVEPDSPYIQKAINALLTPEIARQHKNYFAGGDALDADGRGGNKSVTAWILSTAHVPEDIPLLAEEIRISFSHLSGALEYKRIDEFTKESPKFRYYKPGVKFPGENHICLLDNTHSWRTEENLKTARDAMVNCTSIMKDIDSSILFRKPKEFGGSFLGPFNFGWRTQNHIESSDLLQIINDPKNRFRFGFWLRNMIRQPVWAMQTTQPYELLAELIETDTLMDIMTDNSLSGLRFIWGIEPHWHNKTAVKCDLLFTVLKVCWPVLVHGKT
jgi:hypothetical protein